MNRRAFLRRTGAAAAVPAFASSTAAGEEPLDSPASLGTGTPGETNASPARTIMDGTEHATPVYVNESGSDGPTALVVGGVHGDERPGYLAAGRLRSRVPDAGTLVVLPRANQVAIERDTREGKGGDLNRQFPADAPPETELAEGIWNFVRTTDPDVVVDLHRSVGIYRRHDASVGQAIFPAEVDDAPGVAEAVVDRLNSTAVPWYMPLHEFVRGNVITGEKSMLVHKVVGELDRPGYIVETTRFLVDTETQATWLTEAATALLARHGVDLADEGEAGTTEGES